MKCPLMPDKNYGAQLERTMATGDCIKEECAWWDSIIQECLIYALHTDLAAIHARLGDIAKELTLIRPRGR